MNIPRPVPGEPVDLRPYGEKLPFEGKYREMVINALSRILKTRGVKAIMPD